MYASTDRSHITGLGIMILIVGLFVTVGVLMLIISLAMEVKSNIEFEQTCKEANGILLEGQCFKRGERVRL